MCCTSSYLRDIKLRITGINPYSHKNITQDKIRKQSSKQNPFQSSNYPQIIDLNLLNHTNNIAFTRRMEEHRSWENGRASCRERV